MSASTYVAMVADGHGEPGDVLRLAERVRQPIAAGEIRIACEAVGLNFLDIALCRGSYPQTPPAPFTPGVEVAGRVIEAGEGAEHLLGADVVACPALPRGALGDEVVIDAALAVIRPPGVDPVSAAALPVTYQTSWFALERAGVSEGSTVLVNAGAGGVGTAAVQLAVARGARVITTSGGPQKAAMCLAQGASDAIDYEAEDVVSQIREITAGRGVDAVIDPVGGPMTETSLSCLAFEGTLVAVGSAGGESHIDPTRLMGANVNVVGLSWGSQYPWARRADVAHVYDQLFELAESGRIRPAVQRVVGLAEAGAALDDLAARRTTGKVIVMIGRGEQR